MTDLDLVANYISELLALPVSLRLSKGGKPVEIFDNSGSPEWEKHREAALAQFRRAWRIERDPAHKGGYLFWRR